MRKLSRAIRAETAPACDREGGLCGTSQPSGALYRMDSAGDGAGIPDSLSEARDEAGGGLQSE